MAVLHYVSREQLMGARSSTSRSGPSGEARWKVSHPDGPDAAVPAWFSLTPRSPSIDSRVGASDVELSATLATFGGITGPGIAASRGGGSEPPEVVLGGNPVAPGTPAGPVHERSGQCAVRLRITAEGLGRGRQCLVLIAVAAVGSGDHRVQILLGDTTMAEDPIGTDERLALLMEVPDDGRLRVELWFRLASTDTDARLGVRGVQGHLL